MRLECEQAALNCHIAKTLAVKYKIANHRPWHVAKHDLSLYCLQKCLTAQTQLQRVACYGVVHTGQD